MKFCILCGKELSKDAAFCTGCGAAAPPVSERMSSCASPYSQPPKYAPVTHPKSGVTFRNAVLGFIIPALLLIMVLIAGSGSPVFYKLLNLKHVFTQSVSTIAIALAVVLPARAKGPDLSAGAISGLSAIVTALVVQSGGTWLTGLLLSIAVAAAIGAVNGIINGLIRIPSSVLTVLISVIVTGFISYVIRQLTFILTRGASILAHIPEVSLTAAGVLILLIAFAAVFLLNFTTPLGSPLFKRNRPISVCILSYMISAVIAAFAGFYLLLHFRAVTPMVSAGNEPLILFVFACLLSSRALDNRIAPALYAMLLAVIWTFFTNLLTVYSVNTFYQYAFFIILAASTLTVAFVSRYEKRVSGSLPSA